jgi:hypothetical protein
MASEPRIPLKLVVVVTAVVAMILQDDENSSAVLAQQLGYEAQIIVHGVRIAPRR